LTPKLWGFALVTTFRTSVVKLQGGDMSAQPRIPKTSRRLTVRRNNHVRRLWRRDDPATTPVNALRHLQSATGEHELRRSLYAHSSSRGERFELTSSTETAFQWMVLRPWRDRRRKSRYASRSTHWKPCPSNLPWQAIAVRRPLSQRPTDAQREAVARREGAARRIAVQA
jgi:hypothetical protein